MALIDMDRAQLVHHRSEVDVTQGPRAAVVRIRLDKLRLGDWTRLDGVKMSYVQVLAQLDGDWAPILVDRTDNTIIDGHYRYLAARVLKHIDIECELFDGDKAEAFAEAVRRNTRHGLPLTLAERESAARRILEDRPEWSDRRIAEQCALAPGTVARLRFTFIRPTAPFVQLNKRTGLHNRARPVDPAAARQRVIEAIEANPTASLRALARVAGSSPETVRSVKARLAAESESVATLSAIEQSATSDAALTSTERGQQFAEWFEGSTVTEADWSDFVAEVPISRIYELADEARRRAASWQEFAAALERRIKR